MKNSFRFIIFWFWAICPNSQLISQITTILTSSDDLPNWLISMDLLFSKQEESIDPRLDLALAELNVNNLNYLVVEGEPQKVLLKDKNDYLYWVLIANRQDYFLLCATQTLNDPCRCLDRFYLYIPDKNLLQKIKPWYAWPSLAKKNLVKTLNSYSLETLNANDFATYCELITYLKK